MASSLDTFLLATGATDLKVFSAPSQLPIESNSTRAALTVGRLIGLPISSATWTKFLHHFYLMIEQLLLQIYGHFLANP